MNISLIDTIIVITYLVGIMVVGILAGYKKNTSSEDFFLGGRSLKWPIIGTGLFCAETSGTVAATGSRGGAGYQRGCYQAGSVSCGEKDAY